MRRATFQSMRPSGWRSLAFGGAVVVVLLSGCASFGPGTIGRDRLDYDHAVTESWKQQLLLNLVKLRYGDAPMFLDVASIINSYTLEAQVNVGKTWLSGGMGDSTAVGGLGHYADKPTITYSPMLGERFVRSLMTPIPPGVVLSLLQAGWGADGVFRVMVSSINGIQNRWGAAGPRARGADPDFYRLTAALRRAQGTGAVGMRIEKTKDQEWTMLTIPPENGPPDIAESSLTIRKILGINPEARELRVVYGSGRKSNDEVSMITRSMLEILVDTASTIEVPAAHAEEGRTYQTAVFDTDGPGGYQPLMRIRSGQEKPGDAFSAVYYRGHWFWVEDKDYRTKSFHSLLLILMSLTDTSPAKGAPIVTIPAG